MMKNKYYCCDCKKEIDYYKSKRCWDCYVKIKVPWNKGKKMESPPWNKGKKCPEIQGKNHYNWKGGKTIQMGYVYVLAPGHPKARVSKKNPHGYVAEHVLVMEKKIGRYLQGKECVHHIDEDKTNNKISNLKLFKNNRDHKVYHRGYKHTEKSKEKMRKCALIREAKKRNGI